MKILSKISRAIRYFIRGMKSIFIDAIAFAILAFVVFVVLENNFLGSDLSEKLDLSFKILVWGALAITLIRMKRWPTWYAFGALAMSYGLMHLSIVDWWEFLLYLAFAGMILWKRYLK